VGAACANSMRYMSAGQIVVGVDDSAGTELALRWAADEALARHVPVRLVTAFRYELTAGRLPTFVTVPAVDLLEPRQVAEQLLAKAVDSVTADGAEASAEAVDGDPIQVLVTESASASVLVLGSRQLNAFGSAVLGSVSSAVAARSNGPTVVVRGPAGRPEEGAGVVVGIDGTESSERLLGYAFEHASRHRVPLRAVLCWHPDLLALMSWRAEPPPPARVDAWLAEALAGWQEKYPNVTVHPEVIREHPTAGLVLASAAQHLLVVGKHGRHARAMLGSVSQGVLHHATCPVAVMPTNGE
jgi:nucleotide-binding universal stress UspA family protein